MKSTILKFPPFWVGIIFAAIIMLGTCICIWLGWEPVHPTIDGRVFLIILFFIMLLCFTSYTVTENGITCKFLGLSIRRIPWTDITTVVFLSENKDGKAGQGYVLFAVYPKRIDVVAASGIMQRGYIPASNMVRLRIPIGQERHYFSEISRFAEQFPDIEVLSCC